MAKTVGLLSPQQCATDSPRTFVKKSRIEIMIRRLEAVWIVPNQLAQELIVRTRSHNAAPLVYTDGRIRGVEWKSRESGPYLVMQAEVYRYA